MEAARLPALLPGSVAPLLVLVPPQAPARSVFQWLRLPPLSSLPRLLARSPALFSPDGTTVSATPPAWALAPVTHSLRTFLLGPCSAARCSHLPRGRFS